jgi:hypothetical protein
MNTPTPNPDDEDAMRDALRRDAARVTEPAFDAALHHSTMRRLRALATPPAKRAVLPWWPAIAAGTACLLLVVLRPDLRRQPENFAVTTGSKLPGEKAPLAAHGEVGSDAPLPRSGLVTYQVALRAGDDALLAALDRDARVLLPASPAIFAGSLSDPLSTHLH